jgi:uncharacterized integral membrane protein (TIGR00698 family)
LRTIAEEGLSTAAVSSVPAQAPASRWSRRWSAWSGYVPGLALAAAIGVVAAGTERLLAAALGTAQSPIEALVIAILIGIGVRNTVGQPAAAARGVSLFGKQILEFAVLLLGASVAFGQLLQAGPAVLLLIALCVGLTLALSTTIGRALGLGAKLAILVAVGNAICGNSAIAAVAPAIRADKKDVTVSIAFTAVVGVGLILGLPFLVPLLQMSEYRYGVLVGTTVYAVPQVVAASFPVSVESGEVATFVKLVRVLLLGPAVVFFSVLYARERGAAGVTGLGRLTTYVPWFISGFLVLAALNSLGVIGALSSAIGLAPNALAVVSKDVSKLLMIGAMAALGLGVEFAALRKLGPRVLATVVLSILCLIGISLSLIYLLRL